MQNRKLRLRFVYGGMAMGLVFALVFVRMPRWAAPVRLAELFYGALLMSFASAGGYLGEYLYKRHMARSSRSELN